MAGDDVKTRVPSMGDEHTGLADLRNTKHPQFLEGKYLSVISVKVNIYGWFFPYLTNLQTNKQTYVLNQMLMVLCLSLY